MEFTFDSVLNIIVPLAAMMFFAAVMYEPLKGPIDIAFGWMKDGFMWIIDKFTGGGEEGGGSISYEPRY